MKIIDCDKSYSRSILEIFNDAIINSTALYDYKPRTMENMENWFTIKTSNNFPVIGVVDEQNELLGFGSYGTFRAWPAYHYTLEHSLYIHKDHRRKGIGKILLKEIIARAVEQNYHCLVAGIDSSNTVSIKLHESFGFEFSGRIKQAGYKFSRWLDLDFYQLILPTPEHPVER
jgi:L-amino acid N-acyltransferase